MIGFALLAQAAFAIDDNAVIGWDGDKHGVIEHLNGSYRIRRDEGGPSIPQIYDISFGIYDKNPSSASVGSQLWYNEKSPRDTNKTGAAGYLPCLVTRFERSAEQCTVWISNFGNQISVPRQGGNDRFVFIYTRITVLNNGQEARTIDPAPTVSPSSGPGPVSLTKNSIAVQPRQRISHDYVLAADRFGGTYAWPSEAELLQAGSWDQNFARMARYWDEKLSGIVNITDLPDSELIRAYKAGYIYTLIVKDGDELKVGEEKYEDEVFENDKAEILATLLTIGDPDGLRYLKAFPTSGWTDIGYQAKWKYPWLWALYLTKYPNADRAVSEHLPKIKSLTREIHDQDRCLKADECSPEPPAPPTPNRIIKPRYALEIPSPGSATLAAKEYWAMDNWAALTGLASYKYICEKLSGDLGCVDPANGVDERKWAESEYTDLFSALSTVHANTIQRLNLDYLPVDVYSSNAPPVLYGPGDAGWAMLFSFGHWAWDGYLLGVPPQDGIELGMIDPTYSSRFEAAGLECDNFGAFHSIGYSSAYNAGYGSAALRGETYRSEGILAYEFMLERGQSGPFSWWESFTLPLFNNTPWLGTHPGGPVSPAFSCPHITGQAMATKVLVDSLAALKGDGTVIIGRGVPNAWVTRLLTENKVIRVLNFPILNGMRMGFTLSGIRPNQIRLNLDDPNPKGDTILDLQALKNNIRAVTAGRASSDDGTVTLPSGTKTTTVTLKVNELKN